MKHHNSIPVTIHGIPQGAYISARDCELWYAHIAIAIDIYKAPEIRDAAMDALKGLQRLFVAGAKGTDAVDVSEIIAASETP